MPLQQMGPRRLFRPSNFRSPGATPPESYVCFRCGQKGHYIQNCPTNTDTNYDRVKVRKTTGIPRSFLKPVNVSGDGSGPGNFLVTPEGNLVVAAPNEQEWDRIATIKSLADIAHAIPPELIPEELKCPSCSMLLNDAIRLECCKESFCDECIRNLFDNSPVSALEENVTITCPVCQRTGISQEMVLPCLEKRNQVADFIESHNKFIVPGSDVANGTAVSGENDDTLTAQTGKSSVEINGSTDESRKDGVQVETKRSPPIPPFMPPFPFLMPGFMPLPPRPGMPMMPHRMPHGMPHGVPPASIMPLFPLPPPEQGDERKRLYSPSNLRSRSRSRSRSPSPQRSSQSRTDARPKSRSPI